MNAAQVQTLNRIGINFPSGIDPLLLAYTLFQYNLIHDKILQKIIHLYSLDIDRAQVCQELFRHLPTSCSLDTLIDILIECGYKELVDIVLSKFNVNVNTSRQFRTRTNIKNTVHVFFTNLKRIMHNGSLKDKNNPLGDLENLFRAQLKSVPNTEQRRTLIADKYSAFLGAKIDYYGVTFSFKDGEPDLSAFSALRSLRKKCSNSKINDVMYFSRLAHIRAIQGNFSEAFNLLTEAHQSACNFEPCLELTSLFFIDVVIRLRYLEIHPSEDNLSSLLEMAQNGIECVSVEKDRIRILWTRCFKMWMIFGLLGIGACTNIIPEYCPLKERVDMAKQLLASVDRNWEEIDFRREMQYCISRARIVEFEGNVCLAHIYASRAVKVATQGVLEEIDCIKSYVKFLQEKSLDFFWQENLPVVTARRVRAFRQHNRSLLSSLSQRVSNIIDSHTLESSRTETGDSLYSLSSPALSLPDIPEEDKYLSKSPVKFSSSSDSSRCCSFDQRKDETVEMEFLQISRMRTRVVGDSINSRDSEQETYLIELNNDYFQTENDKDNAIQNQEVPVREDDLMSINNMGSGNNYEDDQQTQNPCLLNDVRETTMSDDDTSIFSLQELNLDLPSFPRNESLHGSL